LDPRPKFPDNISTMVNKARGALGLMERCGQGNLMTLYY